MIKLSDILDQKCIKLEMTAPKKKEAVAELLEAVKDAGKISADQAENILKDIMIREKTSSTGIGDGVAIPHKLVEGLEKSIMVFGRKKGGINFDSIDGKPASLFFLILGQHGNSTGHLRILSKLARLLHDPSFRNTLQTADTPGEVITALKKQEEE